MGPTNLNLGKNIRKKSISDLEIYEDYALLRRYLVDYQYLERDKFGKIIRNVSNTQKLYKWLFKVAKLGEMNQV